MLTFSLALDHSMMLVHSYQLVTFYEQMNEKQIQVVTLPQSLTNLASGCKRWGFGCLYIMLKLFLFLFICMMRPILKY